MPLSVENGKKLQKYFKGASLRPRKLTVSRLRPLKIS